MGDLHLLDGFPVYPIKQKICDLDPCLWCRLWVSKIIKHGDNATSDQHGILINLHQHAGFHTLKELIVEARVLVAPGPLGHLVALFEAFIRHRWGILSL